MLVSTMNALPVPPAVAMPLRFDVSVPTPMTNVRIFGVAAAPAVAIASTSASRLEPMLLSHSLGSPSVARMTIVTSDECVLAHAVA